MKPILRILILVVACTGTAYAGGEWRGSTKDEVHTYGPPPFYANGCYWRRGVRYCSSYCYLEINGYRYCNPRESEAVPQGDPYSPERPTVEEIYRVPLDARPPRRLY